MDLNQRDSFILGVRTTGNGIVCGWTQGPKHWPQGGREGALGYRSTSARGTPSNSVKRYFQNTGLGQILQSAETENETGR